MSAVVDAVHQHSGIVGKSERTVQIIVIAALIYQRRTLVVIVRAGEVQLVGREHFQFHTVGDIAEIADVLFNYQDAIANGQSSPEDAAKAIQDAIDAYKSK